MCCAVAWIIAAWPREPASFLLSSLSDAVRRSRSCDVATASRSWTVSVLMTSATTSMTRKVKRYSRVGDRERELRRHEEVVERQDAQKRRQYRRAPAAPAASTTTPRRYIMIRLAPETSLWRGRPMSVHSATTATLSAYCLRSRRAGRATRAGPEGLARAVAARHEHVDLAAAADEVVDKRSRRACPAMRAGEASPR